MPYYISADLKKECDIDGCDDPAKPAIIEMLAYIDDMPTMLRFCEDHMSLIMEFGSGTMQ